jgi:hypothetical protein
MIISCLIFQLILSSHGLGISKTELKKPHSAPISKPGLQYPKPKKK